MFKQLILPMAGVAAFIILVGLLVKNPGKIVIPGVPTPAPALKTITIADKQIDVEIADTEEERKLGLGGRTSLDGNTGMLFVFEAKSVSPTFWMKDMLIPLDIIWIKDSKVVKIDKNIPAPAKDTADDRLTHYTTGTPVDYVLEVNAGFSDKNNLKVGDPVDLSNLQ